MSRRKTLKTFGAALAGTVLSAAARAEQAAWPTARPITYIVPFFPGSTADVLGRLVAQKVGAMLGQSFVVENRAGMGGSIGASAVARAAPDGYTLMHGTSGTHAANATLYKNLPYDPVKDFEPIVLMGSVSSVLVVSPTLGINSVAELIALLKKDEARRSFGSAGAGTSPHLAGELFAETIGVKLTHVPYKGTPAILDVASGQLTFMFDQLGTTLQLVRSGKVKALAVTAPQRVGLLPNVPTMIESGVPGFSVTSWHALYAPKDTPKPIVDRLATDVAAVLKTPDSVSKLAQVGLEVSGAGPTQLAALMAREIPRWGEVIKRSGATPD